MKPKRIISLLVCLLLVLSLAQLSAAASLPDVSGHWAEETVEWGIETDMVKGYPDGTFRPDREVTEAEFLTLMLRAYDVENGNGEYDHWADSSYEIAEEYNVKVEGFNSIDKRNTYIDRTSVAEITSGAQGVRYDGREAILYLLMNGLAEGRVPGEITVGNYEGDELLTRAESVQFIKNVLERGVDEIKERPFEPSEPLPDRTERPVVEIDEWHIIKCQDTAYELLMEVIKTIDIDWDRGEFRYYLPLAPEGFRWSIAGRFHHDEGIGDRIASIGDVLEEGKIHKINFDPDKFNGEGNFSVRLIKDWDGPDRYCETISYDLEDGNIRKYSTRD